jgi:hypothetical protein
MVGDRFARVLARWSPRGASHPRPVWGSPGSSDEELPRATRPILREAFTNN